MQLSNLFDSISEPGCNFDDFEIALVPISIVVNRPGPLVRACSVRMAILLVQSLVSSVRAVVFFLSAFFSGRPGLAAPWVQSWAHRCGRTAVARFLTPRPRFSCPSRAANGRPVSQLHNHAWQGCKQSRQGRFGVRPQINYLGISNMDYSYYVTRLFSFHLLPFQTFVFFIVVINDVILGPTDNIWDIWE